MGMTPPRGRVAIRPFDTNALDASARLLADRHRAQRRSTRSWILDSRTPRRPVARSRRSSPATEPTARSVSAARTSSATSSGRRAASGGARTCGSRAPAMPHRNPRSCATSTATWPVGGWRPGRSDIRSSCRRMTTPLSTPGSAPVSASSTRTASGAGGERRRGRATRRLAPAARGAARHRGARSDRRSPSRSTRSHRRSSRWWSCRRSKPRSPTGRRVRRSGLRHVRRRGRRDGRRCGARLPDRRLVGASGDRPASERRIPRVRGGTAGGARPRRRAGARRGGARLGTRRRLPDRRHRLARNEPAIEPGLAAARLSTDLPAAPPRDRLSVEAGGAERRGQAPRRDRRSGLGGRAPPPRAPSQSFLNWTMPLSVSG